MVSSRFLPFQEARQYVRGLGLKSWHDWRHWSKSGQRPRFIPSRPDMVYGEEFLGHPDFLGFSRRRSFKEIPLGELNTTCRRVNVRKQGLADFLVLMGRYVPGMEFKPFFKDSFITFIVRPRNVNHQNDRLWAALHVRFTTGGQQQSARFTHVTTVRHTFGFLGYELADGELYFFPYDDRFPDTIEIRKNISSKYLRYRLHYGDLTTFFADYYKRNALDTAPGWLQRSFSSERDIEWGIVMSQLWSMIYDPLGLAVEFDFEQEGQGSNMLIDGRHTLHRRAYIDSKNNFQASMYRSINGVAFPFSATDSFEFLMVVVAVDVDCLQGFFLFPKTVLMEKEYLRDADREAAGVHNIPLFLPEKIAEDKVIGRKYKWQKYFFIDMSNLDDARRKFLDIFNGFRKS